MFAPNEDQWRRDCRQAADLLRRDGWCQGTSRKSTGERCLMNAVRTASGSYEDENAVDRLNNILSRLQLKLNMTFPAYWNDVKGRTVEEVVDLLEDMAVEFE
jgi:hypothetical protein